MLKTIEKCQSEGLSVFSVTQVGTDVLLALCGDDICHPDIYRAEGAGRVLTLIKSCNSLREALDYVHEVEGEC